MKASFELLTLEEANRRPAGLGRGDPNTNPTLQAPKRDPDQAIAPWEVHKQVERKASRSPFCYLIYPSIHLSIYSSIHLFIDPFI